MSHDNADFSDNKFAALPVFEVFFLWPGCLWKVFAIGVDPFRGTSSAWSGCSVLFAQKEEKKIGDGDGYGYGYLRMMVPSQAVELFDVSFRC